MKSSTSSENFDLVERLKTVDKFKILPKENATSDIYGYFTKLFLISKLLVKGFP